MNDKIRIAIVGMGNVGKAVFELAKKSTEFEVIETFDRRTVGHIWRYEELIDVVLVCVGSRIDAVKLTPELVKAFNTVDSFDTHSLIETYKNSINRNQKNGLVSIISAGWDPGLLSVLRILLRAFISDEVRTFHGSGVSLGHTNAIKTIRGVKDAVQITEPIERENRHKRVCFVVAEDENEKARIEKEIKTMPEYFAPYETEVHFISKIPRITKHAGTVTAKSKETGARFLLRMKNNTKFTASIMLVYAKVNYKLQKMKRSGVFSAANIEPALLLEQASEFI